MLSSLFIGCRQTLFIKFTLSEGTNSEFTATHSFSGFLNLHKDDGRQDVFKRRLKHYKTGGFVKPRLSFVIRRWKQGDDGVHGRLKWPFCLIVQNHLDVAMFEQEFLKVFAVSDIQPRVGRDKAERAFRIQQWQPMQVEIDVQVTFGIKFA